MSRSPSSRAVSHEKPGICAWLNEHLPHLSIGGIALLAVYEAVMVCVVGPVVGQ